MSRQQSELWERPKIPRDETPLEAGGSVVSFRLTPAEARYLRTINDTDTIAALHELIRRLARPAAETEPE